MKIVILAGGSWTRLWPLSTKNTPKQFLKLYGNKSLIEYTYDRVVDLVWGNNIFVSTSGDYAKTITSLFTWKEFGWVIVETEKRNTGPALLFCVKKMCHDFWLEKDEPIIFLPADHIIKPKDVFMNYLSYWADNFWNQSIMVFWIVPRTPHTWFWYIKAGKSRSQSAYSVDKFTEKPTHEKATLFLAEGWYYRNSWIYMCSYHILVQELEKHYKNWAIYLQWPESPEEWFSSLDPVSFDYMLAEKTENAVVIPMSLQRSDVGTWEVIDEITEKDKEWNVCMWDVQMNWVENTYVSAENMNIKVVGVDWLIVVQQWNNIMIAKKWKSQNIKNLL